MSSRATVALLRLKEIDKKYKSSREKVFESISEISAVTSDEKIGESEKSQTTLLRPQLNIKLPDTFGENVESLSSNSDDEDHTPVRVLKENSKSLSISSQLEGSEKNDKNINNLISSSSSKKDEKIFDSEEIEEMNGDTFRESVSEIFEQITEVLEEVSESINDSQSQVTGVEERIEDIYDKSEQLNENQSNSGEYSEDTFESVSSDNETDENSKKSAHDMNEKVDLRPEIEVEMVENGLKDSGTIIKKHKSIYDMKNRDGEEYKNDLKDDSLREETNTIQTRSAESKLISEKTETSTESTFGTLTSSQNSSKNIQNSSSEKEFSKNKSNERKSFGTSESVSKYQRKVRKSRKSSRKSFENERIRGKVGADERKSNLSMIRYLRQIEEDRQSLLVWPTSLLCSKKAQLKIFKPLELPNAINIISSDKTVYVENQWEDPSLEILRNRLLDIRQWLKDQYSIYKEQSEQAASMNSNYILSNLEDKEKIIRHLRLISKHRN